MTHLPRLFLLAAVSLAGCAHTPSEFREQVPTFESFSEKQPAPLLGCITEHWDARGHVTSYKPLMNGGSVSIDLPILLISFNNKIGVVDAELIDGRTRVRVYGVTMQGKKSAFAAIDDVKSCL